MSQTAGRMSMSDMGGRMSMSEGRGMHNRKGSRVESDAFLPTGEDLSIRSADYVSPRAKFVQCSMLILVCTFTVAVWGNRCTLSPLCFTLPCCL